MEISKEELQKIYITYIRLNKKEPKNYDELLNYFETLSSIIKTYDVTYDQIDEELISKFKNLLNL